MKTKTLLYPLLTAGVLFVGYAMWRSSSAPVAASSSTSGGSSAPSSHRAAGETPSSQDAPPRPDRPNRPRPTPDHSAAAAVADAVVKQAAADSVERMKTTDQFMANPVRWDDQLRNDLTALGITLGFSGEDNEALTRAIAERKEQIDARTAVFQQHVAENQQLFQEMTVLGRTVGDGTKGTMQERARYSEFLEGPLNMERIQLLRDTRAAWYRDSDLVSQLGRNLSPASRESLSNYAARRIEAEQAAYQQ